MIVFIVVEDAAIYQMVFHTDEIYTASLQEMGSPQRLSLHKRVCKWVGTSQLAQYNMAPEYVCGFGAPNFKNWDRFSQKQKMGRS